MDENVIAWLYHERDAEGRAYLKPVALVAKAQAGGRTTTEAVLTEAGRHTHAHSARAFCRSALIIPPPPLEDPLVWLCAAAEPGKRHTSQKCMQTHLFFLSPDPVIATPPLPPPPPASLLRPSSLAAQHRDGFFRPGTTYGWLKPHQHLATAPRTDLFSHFQAACDEWVSATQCSSSDDDSSDGSSTRSDESGDDHDSSDDSSAWSDESDGDHGYHGSDGDRVSHGMISSRDLFAEIRSALCADNNGDDRDDTCQPTLEPILEEVAGPTLEPPAATAPVEAHPPAGDAVSPATT